MFSKRKLQLLAIPLVFLAQAYQDDETCDSTFDYLNGVEWSATVDRSLSKPLCLNKNKEFLYRECVKGRWSQAPFCYSLQQETLPQCPYGFTDVGKLCYRLTQKTPFPPRCPFENNVPFYYYKDLVTNESYGPIWVPARRKDLGFAMWTETSWLYGEEVKSYNFTKPLRDKECLVYFKQTYTAVSCSDSKFTGVCAYDKLDRLTDNNLCQARLECRQSDFDVSSKCFCVESRTSSDQVPAEFVKSYQYNLYKKLTNKTCAIGLRKNLSSGKYVWKNSDEEIDYAFWSPAANFSNRNIYGAGTPDGWILTKVLATCVISQTDVVNLEPSLSLWFDEEDDRFLLTMKHPKALRKNPEILVFCFTNADDQSFSFKYSEFTVEHDFGDSVVYSFYPLRNASGHYWCEAFKHIDSSVIKSNVYFHRPKLFLEFVGIFQIPYDNDTNPLSSDITTVVQELLFGQIDSSTVQAVRVMAITDLEEEPLQRVSVNVHFTLTERVDAEDAENQFLLFQHYLEQVLQNSQDIQMVDFRSSDFCISEHGSLTWPKVPIGSIVSPLEFCFTDDATLVTRTCRGNFIDGGQWSAIEPCKIFDASPITEKLLQVSNNYSLESMHQVYRISLDYQQFTSLDVYLVGKMYSELLYIHNISVFGETINNLLKINKSELMEAQLKLGATDKFLYFVDHINFEYESTFNLSFENFSLVSLTSKDLSGLIVVKGVDDRFVVTKLIGDHSLKNISRIDNLVSAIWLSPEFRNNLWSYEKITFSVYFEDALFPQKDHVKTSIILGVMRPKSVDVPDGPVYVLHRSSNHQKDNNYCSSWSYSLADQGSWKHFQKATTPFPPFLFCDYWHFANYAITSPDDGGAGGDHGHHLDDSDQVTDDLKNLLESNDSVPQTMEKLSRITQEFSRFAPIDVGFVGQILERVSDDEQLDFTHLARTVSNLQRVSRDVLSQSQMDETSTDKILSLVDHIVERHRFESTVTVASDDFMIFVLDPRENFSGMALFERENSFEPLFFYANDSVEDVSEQEGFDSAVIFSAELQQQLLVDTKIIINVYLSDALFNEKYPKPGFVSKIFDVILPEVEDFQGPLFVLFKKDAPDFDHGGVPIEQNVSRPTQCVFWNYDHRTSGSWKKDHDVKNFSNIVRCEFWHTTHFAYLILDQDKFSDDEFHNLFDLLGLLTSVTCGISLLSLTFIVLTAACFKQWRDNSGNKILLNFSLVIIIQIVVFYVSTWINEAESYIPCTVIGILLHYSIVSQFCWMFVIAILQFRRFVTVLEAPPSYVLLKACVCGWILPLLPVFCVFGLDRENYVKSNVGLCYPSGLGLYLGVWLPVCIIILINFVIFSITLYSVVHKKTEYVNGSSDALYQWRLAVLLFFILGFTWCFAFLAELDFGLVFAYIFCMTATLQGFTLFLFFILCNANTRYLYVNAVGKYCKRKFR